MNGVVEIYSKINAIWCHVLNMATPITRPETLSSTITDEAACLVFAFHVLSLNSYAKTIAQTSFASCLALLSLGWPTSLQPVLTFLSPGRAVVGERNEFHSPNRAVFRHRLRDRKQIFPCLTPNLFFFQPLTWFVLSIWLYLIIVLYFTSIFTNGQGTLHILSTGYL